MKKIQHNDLKITIAECVLYDFTVNLPNQFEKF